MPTTVQVSISTEVIEDNARCIVRTEFRDDVATIFLDARKQKHHEILGIGTRVRLHWSKEPRVYEVQELSSFPWPIRYHVTTADAWYTGPDGTRAHYTPPLIGLDSHARVSHAVKRAAILLIVIGAIGYRRAAWLLDALFQVSISKSSLGRWIKEEAERLPSKEQIVELLNARKPITEAHFDEIFPKGKAGPGCVLVVRDEHGRIVASERIENRDEEHVRPFLEWLKDRGLGLRTFYIDHCQTYRKVIPQVFEGVRIQLDYFHIIQNIWKHLWKYMVSFRKSAKKRGNESGTPWYKRKLLNLATSLWKNRHLLFKSEKNLSDEERVKLVKLCEADS